eukprot:CAMPEP_0202345828 /NCGR_PEP_ID=MMETSP1126-20121109/4893_1 /ASSEMBLY_ACC=CAM_ASM_000457 /TAXON_ID=3047 /ORGANISM="Dunaliella tertiolecta, Strain CCMP1320" /LENGTH=308 /DNA_ID=CAMNT_0048937175 /DNA_START=2191 /DNA_END=3117 /DNA_ORIENTATION=+
MEDGSQEPPQESRPRAGRRAGGGAPAPVQASTEEEIEEQSKQEASPSPPEEPVQPRQQEEQPQQEQQQQQENTTEDSEGDDLAPPAPPATQPPLQQNEESSKNNEGGDGAGKESISTLPAPAPPRIQGRRAGATVGGFMGASAASTAGGEQEARAADPLAAPGEGMNKQLTGVSKRKQEQHAQLAEQKVKANSKYDERVLDAEVLDIPELEEEGKEDLSRLVAEAPKIRTNKVQGIVELDEDMQYMLPAAGDKDIDLSMLTAVLASSEQVDEKDDIWTPETLLVQLASELNSEMEKAEGRKEAAVSKS